MTNQPAIDPPPHEGRGLATWSTRAWRERAVAWIDRELDRRGLSRTADVGEPRVRAWSTVMRIPTSDGTMWFKAASQETAAEVALYRLLTTAAPQQVLHPIAADIARGWLLLPDGGASLGEILGTAEVARLLERVLPEYGELQLAMAPHVPSLLALGLQDMRPATMPRRFDEAAAAVRLRVRADERDAFDRAMAFRPTFDAWTRQLAESPVPHSIDHNDLHAANILVPPGDLGAAARFYDWGDALVSHPFATLLHGLGWVPAHLRVAEDDPVAHRLRDAYLGAFSGFGPHPELVRTLELACRVAKIARCFSWARALGMGDPAHGFERAPVELFTGIPNASYLSPV